MNHNFSPIAQSERKVPIAEKNEEDPIETGHNISPL